eukprot:352606-Amphidinium_carterae.1
MASFVVLAPTLVRVAFFKSSCAATKSPFEDGTFTGLLLELSVLSLDLERQPKLRAYTYVQKKPEEGSRAGAVQGGESSTLAGSVVEFASVSGGLQPSLPVGAVQTLESLSTSVGR